MFYTYRQNNSGGSFSYDEKRGISVNVIIEARDAYEANRYAERVGLYFNGCDSGMDCSCCGDRWYEAGGSYDVNPVPMVYGEEVKPNQNFPAEDECNSGMKWMKEGTPEGFIHYSDGRIEPFYADINQRKDLDGSYGYGVQFSRNYANTFLVGKNGWDETGNYEAAKHGKDPVVEIVGNYGWGRAWFPTEDEAQMFADEINKSNDRVWKAIQTEVRKVRKDANSEQTALSVDKEASVHNLISDVMKIWRKDMG